MSKDRKSDLLPSRYEWYVRPFSWRKRMILEAREAVILEPDWAYPESPSSCEYQRMPVWKSDKMLLTRICWASPGAGLSSATRSLVTCSSWFADILNGSTQVIRKYEYGTRRNVGGTLTLCSIGSSLELTPRVTKISMRCRVSKSSHWRIRSTEKPCPWSMVRYSVSDLHFRQPFRKCCITVRQKRRMLHCYCGDSVGLG